MINTRRVLVVTIALFVFASIIHLFDRSDFAGNHRPKASSLGTFRSKHWLILTSAQQLQQCLAAAHPPLSVVLIGEHARVNPSSHANVDLVYLDSKLQATLSFRSKNIRNVAYLLAIQHGARFIYEFNSNKSCGPFEYFGQNVQHVAFRRARSPFVNIHPTFTADFKSVTPGLPQDELRNITEDGWSSIRTLVHIDQEAVHPLVQQSVPIFYRQQEKPLLTQHPPVAVEPFTFAPFGMDNIMFAYDAFWGLAVPQSQTAFWRSWWVQRLLWDISGHLLFAARYLPVDAAMLMPNERQDPKEDAQVSKLVRYLTEWRSVEATLAERIDQVTVNMIESNFCQAHEIEVIRDWIYDLQSIQYAFPTIKESPSSKGPSGSAVTPRRRRTAVCLTGLIECIEGAWKPTAQAIRTHMTGDMDVFMYLSSTEPVVDQLSTVPLRTRIVEALRYANFTVKVLFENIPKLDPHFPANCTSDASVDQPVHKVPRYYQQLFGLSNCFSLVRDYEKKHNIKYDLMVRSRADIEFLRIPSTFERAAPHNINTTLLIPPNRYGSKLDDGFAIGPIAAVEVYMNRYHSFRECLTRDLHPERYLDFYLNHRKVSMTVDQGTLVGHIPHSPQHCH